MLEIVYLFNTNNYYKIFNLFCVLIHDLILLFFCINEYINIVMYYRCVFPLYKIYINLMTIAP